MNDLNERLGSTLPNPLICQLGGELKGWIDGEEVDFIYL